MMIALQERKLPRTKAGRRKLRLFACGCCRTAWNFLPDVRLKDAIETAEKFADGLASKDELAAARAATSWMRGDSAQPVGTPLHVKVATDMAVATTEAQAYAAAFSMTAMSLPLARCRGEELAGEAALCHLLRCLFGNPFRSPPELRPSLLTWHGGTVVRLAAAAYEERLLPQGTLDPNRLVVLADAVEEAGAGDQAELLQHLRGPGPHVRGCWAVDSLLSRG
jgi:hypothetical protein